MQHISQLAAPLNVEETLLQMMAGNPHPRTQQQRSQAEHLSRVLYNDMAIDSVLVPSTSHVALFSHKKGYGTLESKALLLRQLRNATAPVPRPYEADQRLITALTNDLTNQLTGTLQSQTVVSMRGGGMIGATGVEKQPPPTLLDRSLWITLGTSHVNWNTPFNSGTMYKFFLDSLSNEQSLIFSWLFGEGTSHEHNAHNLNRRLFVAELDPDDKLNFERMIVERAKQLLGPNSNRTFRPGDESERVKINSTGCDRIGRPYPLVCLEQLVDATLQPQNVLGSLPTRTTTRSSSVPNLDHLLVASR
jgi:hypothetical protein